jgi:hypothetical protein
MRLLEIEELHAAILMATEPFLCDRVEIGVPVGHEMRFNG